MKPDNKRQAARKFKEFWLLAKDSETGGYSKFWLSLLSDVLGVDDVFARIDFQSRVPMKGTTKYLDAWIPETRVLIEHKSRGIRLDAPQSGHGGKTPFEQAAVISQTAQAILDARAAHPDCSLADLYDPLTMPPDLRAAHEANDRAVLAAYGLAPDTPEPAIVAHLFGLYADATKATKRTEGTKETKVTEATKGGGQSLKSLPSLSSLEGGSYG